VQEFVVDESLEQNGIALVIVVEGITVDADGEVVVCESDLCQSSDCAISEIPPAKPRSSRGQSSQSIWSLCSEFTIELSGKK
jgi:hypothetical protein